MLAADKIQPRRYETIANLGTFHILRGDFNEGLGYILEALAINPDAHFGREKYQRWLVEYVLESRENGKIVLPLQSAHAKDSPRRGAYDFRDFIGRRVFNGDRGQDFSREAVRGVLGMLRFANFESPVLLEALGDLLLDGDPGTDAKRLAARSYLKASYVTADRDAKARYRDLARRAISFQTQTPHIQQQLSLDELEGDFAKELADANAWYKELKDREIQWIRDGKDTDAEFDRYYRGAPVAAGVDTPGTYETEIEVSLAILALVLFVLWLTSRRYLSAKRLSK
jgi:hypothetical protein